MRNEKPKYQGFGEDEEVLSQNAREVQAEFSESGKEASRPEPVQKISVRLPASLVFDVKRELLAQKEHDSSQLTSMRAMVEYGLRATLEELRGSPPNSRE